MVKAGWEYRSVDESDFDLVAFHTVYQGVEVSILLFVLPHKSLELGAVCLSGTFEIRSSYIEDDGPFAFRYEIELPAKREALE